MGGTKGRNSVPVTEPIPAIEIFYNEIAGIEIIDHMMYFVLTAERISFDGEPIPNREKIVVARLMTPVDRVEGFIRQVQDAMARPWLPRDLS